MVGLITQKIQRAKRLRRMYLQKIPSRIDPYRLAELNKEGQARANSIGKDISDADFLKKFGFLPKVQTSAERIEIGVKYLKALNGVPLDKYIVANHREFGKIRMYFTSTEFFFVRYADKHIVRSISYPNRFSAMRAFSYHITWCYIQVVK